MVDTTKTDCINHPTKPAANWCKQCGNPTCHKCTVIGPTGRFCSDTCRETHEAFHRHSQGREVKAGSTFFLRIRKLVGTLLVLAAVLFAAGMVGTVFYIPVLSELTGWVRGVTGL